MRAKVKRVRSASARHLILAVGAVERELLDAEREERVAAEEAAVRAHQKQHLVEP